MKLMPRRDAKHWYELLTRAYADYFENETAKNVAVGCDGKEGSTVRVRQRALCKVPANRAFRTGPSTELTKSYY